MNQKEAEQVYLDHLKRTEDVINSMGDNPQAINAFITNTYASLSEKEPAFIWFSLGAIVSTSVGRNIEFASQANVKALGQAESSNLIQNSFSQGNQVIFKDIISLYLTYDSIGVEECEKLKNSSFENPFKNKDTLDALKAYTILQEQQEKIANSMGLSSNDPRVMEKLLSDKGNILLMHSVAKGIALEEQGVVQGIYQDKFVDVLLDPKLGWAGHQFKLDEIKILDKSYNFFDYIDNPADFDQRMAFAEILLTAIEDGISSGMLLNHQSNVKDMAEKSLWMGNPYAKADLIGGANGAFWGKLAEDHDKKVNDLVKNFINPEDLIQETAIMSPVDTKDNDIFLSVFTGENKIVKIEIDPLKFFLANNPNYVVIANDYNELWNSSAYTHITLRTGTALLNPQLPYLKDSTFIGLYNNGDYHYHQPYGEVRGITFPFMYDKTTGVPLTKPIVDVHGHYDHASTIDTLYTNPQVFNTPSHINWYNPHWNQVVKNAMVESFTNYVKSITIDPMMDAIKAPFGKSISYDSRTAKLELKANDIFDANSGSIDFSTLKGLGSLSGNHAVNNAGSNIGFQAGPPSDQTYKLVISEIKLAHGQVLKPDSHGHFVCMNCTQSEAKLLEDGANAMAAHLQH